MRGKAKVWAVPVYRGHQVVRPHAKVNHVKLRMVSNTSLQRSGLLLGNSIDSLMAAASGDALNGQAGTAKCAASQQLALCPFQHL